jgi:hypothetical protein
MYNPHLTECGNCLEPFKDEDLVYPFFEDYLCARCATDYVRLTVEPIIWRERDSSGKIKNP